MRKGCLVSLSLFDNIKDNVGSNLKQNEGNQFSLLPFAVDVVLVAVSKQKQSTWCEVMKISAKFRDDEGQFVLEDTMLEGENLIEILSSDILAYILWLSKGRKKGLIIIMKGERELKVVEKRKRRNLSTKLKRIFFSGYIFFITILNGCKTWSLI